MAKAKPIANIDCPDGAGKIIQQVLLARLKNMCALRESALDWDDPDGVHDMRVASRRLRSALSDFKPYVRKEGLPSRRLKAIAKSLGAVRDEDVVLAALDELRSKANDKVAAGIEAIAEEHRRQRRQARSVLETVIKSAALAELREDFRHRLNTAIKPSQSSRDKGQILTFSQVGTKVISERLTKLCDARNAFYQPLRTRQLHKLRILAKRLRYAVELFAPCGGSDYKRIAKEIARLQTALGELHDCDVWIANLARRLKKGEGGGGDRQNTEAAVWLLQHFVSERTKHYAHSLARWHKWQTEGFLDQLRSILDRRFGQSAAPVPNSNGARSKTSKARLANDTLSSARAEGSTPPSRKKN